MRKLSVVALLGILAGVGATGCGDDDDPVADVQDANGEFCQDLAGYRDAAQGFAGLDPTTATKADYSSAASEVRSGREAVLASGQDLLEAEWDNLEAQLNTLGDQLRDAPDDQAVASILAGAQEQAARVEVSAAAVNTAVCASGSAAATTSP